ncbi:MAG: GAF domain-containing protein [Leptospiraceae bacterium]|nr:GAF domain-containing protein [Leptospiraceae bacterium]MCP5512564.1 GAF domain-containing protein [Leptospiraceae bacterium]
MNEPTSEIPCDLEPIHLINQLQDHGLLLILKENSNLIIAVGENSYTYLKLYPEEVLNKNLTKLIPGIEPILNDANRVLASENHHEFKSQLYLPGAVLFATFRKSENFILLEIEKEFQSKILTISNELNVQLSNFQFMNSLQDIYNYAVNEIRSIIQFDRVLLYRFFKDFSGEVIAESRNKNLPSIIGYHFPSSDIPLPARNTYLKNPIRLIQAGQQRPFQIIRIPSYKNYEFDLGSSNLRFSHSHHLEYLQNLGVKTSMSISLSIDNKLWGLFICHNINPIQVGFSARNYITMFSQITMLQIDLMNKNQISSYELDLKTKILNIIQKLNNSDYNDLLTNLENDIDSLMNLLESSGLYIRLLDRNISNGKVPKAEKIELFFDYLTKNHANSIFHTDNLYSLNLSHEIDASCPPGVLAIPISSNPGSWIIWFREEFINKKAWAGNPNEPYSTSGNRISPRLSFSKFIETVKNKSKPWTEIQIKAVEAFNDLRDVIDKKIAEHELANTLEKVKKSEKELRDLNNTRDKFFSIVSHNLRSPFSGLLGFSDMLLESLQEDKNLPYEEILEMAEALQVSSHKAFDLLKNLFEWGKIQTGKIKLTSESLDLSSIIDEILYKMSERLSKKEIQLKANYKEDLLIYTDKDALFQILTHIIQNSIKYSHRGSEILLNATMLSESTQIEIIDSGIGMKEEDIEKLFKIEEHFNMKGTENEDGTGLGLIITKEYLSKLNSSIQIESEPQKGTKITLLFPTNENESTKV